MKILLAVTDRAAGALLVAHLRKRGHELKTVGTGLGCITSLQEEQADVVILQQGILWGGCEGVISRMKEIAFLSNIPIVVLSRDGFPSELAKFLGIEAFLTVPMQLVDIVQLENVFNRLEAASDEMLVDQLVQAGAV